MPEQDRELLETLCTTPESELWDLLLQYFPTIKRTGRYMFAARAADRARVLAVVHTDVRGGDEGVSCTWHHDNGQLIVNSRALDDRLGLFMLVRLSEKCSFDLLVTTDEEISDSSASDFVSDHLTTYTPNWIFSIDRRVNRERSNGIFMPSVVLYQYHDDETERLCEEAGFKVERGTNSDINYMGALGVKGFNFSAGYTNEHSDACHAYVSDVYALISQIENFYQKHKATKLPHNE
jgi:hypothetical protein